jgi:hypothetical protein
VPGQLNRREFAKLAAGACCAAGFLGNHQFYGADAPCQLELFDYSGVRLLDTRFKSQYQSSRDPFLNIPGGASAATRWPHFLLFRLPHRREYQSLSRGPKVELPLRNPSASRRRLSQSHVPARQRRHLRKSLCTVRMRVRIPGWPASFAQRERSAAKRLLQRWKLGESRPKMKLRRQSFDRTPHGPSLRTRRPAASKTCCSGLRSNGSGKAAKASCRRFVAEILQTGAKAQV